MILANSFKGNSGKKYCNYKEARSKELTASDYAKLDEFNTWFTDFGYENLRRQIIGKDVFNEDVFNDTYIKICESLLYTDLDIINYISYFMRSYMTNMTLDIVKENRYTDISEIAYNEDDSNKQINEKENIEIVLKSIDDYLHKNYNQFECEIFNMNIFNKIPQYEIAEKFKTTTSKIHRMIFKIKKDIKNNNILFSNNL